MFKSKFTFIILAIILSFSIISAQSNNRRYRVSSGNNVYVLKKQLKILDMKIISTEKTLSELKDERARLNKSIIDGAKNEIEKKEKSISELKDKKKKIKEDEEKKLKKEKDIRINRKLDSIDKSISDLNNEIEDLRKIKN